MTFTQKKWLSLSQKLREKHLALLVREIWEGKANLEEYNQLVDWLDQAPLRGAIPELLSERYHQHLAAAGLRHKEHNLLPHVRTGDQAEASELLPISIYLDRVRSAHNVGSIIRTMEAFSLGKLLLSDRMADPTHKQVRDAAMGAEEWVPWERCPVDQLPRPLIAIETSNDAVPLHHFRFPETFCLALGNEEFGLSKELLAQADAIIEIPLYGRKNSLNIANCFSIIANEIRSQRSNKTN